MLFWIIIIKIPNLTKYVNEDLLDTFDRMINCDILIISKSKFSRIATILRDKLYIVPDECKHIIYDEDGIASTDKNFDEKIKKYISDRYLRF